MITSNLIRLSIFYGRNQWAVLLKEISYFYVTHKNLISFIYFRFSYYLGDHIDLVVDSCFLDKVQLYEVFQDFVTNTPSDTSQLLEWRGYDLWKHYDNNTVYADIFHFDDRIIYCKNKELNFISMLSRAGLNICVNFDDIDSIYLFLIVQALKYPIMRKDKFLNGVGINVNHEIVSSDVINLLDSYLLFCPMDGSLYEEVLLWETYNNNIFHKSVLQKVSYFYFVYNEIKLQYNIGGYQNEILSSVIMSYYQAKIGE